MDIAYEITKLYPWLYNKARLYYANVMDEEDLVEDTIYKALLYVKKYDRARDLKPLLLAMMHNTYVTQYNRRKVIRFIPGDDILPLQYSYRHTADLVISHDIIRAVARCRRKSVSVECAVLYAKGFSYKEISDLLSLPVNTVRSRISYARRLIRRELE